MPNPHNRRCTHGFRNRLQPIEIPPILRTKQPRLKSSELAKPTNPGRERQHLFPGKGRLAAKPSLRQKGSRTDPRTRQLNLTHQRRGIETPGVAFAQRPPYNYSVQRRLGRLPLLRELQRQNVSRRNGGRFLKMKIWRPSFRQHVSEVGERRLLDFESLIIYSVEALLFTAMFP